jgi:hypothetical protein
VVEACEKSISFWGVSEDGREDVDVQKKRPFQSLRRSRRVRSVLERRKRVNDSVALSRVRLSVCEGLLVDLLGLVR